MLFLRQMLVHLLSLCIFMLSCLSLLCSTTHSSFLNSLSFNPQLFFFPPLNKVNICLACSRSSKESDHTPDFPPFSSYQRATFIKLFSSLCCQRLHWEISYYLNRSEVPNQQWSGDNDLFLLTMVQNLNIFLSNIGKRCS